MNWQQAATPLHRFYSCLPYLLPMSAGVIYGAILFQQFPLLILPFIPFIWLYSNVLSFPLVPFLGLTGEFFLFMGLFFWWSEMPVFLDLFALTPCKPY